MREILFRGKRVDSGEWVLGQVVIRPDHDDGCEKYFICEAEHRFIRCLNKMPCTYEADPETVGQYTGLKDKNGKWIFEGDIVRYVYEPGEGFWNANQLSVISYKKVGFHMAGIFGTNKYACMGGWLESIPFNQEAENIPEFEVIGNIHDNPELIAEVQDG